jgi:hypothetical protein
MPEATTFGTDQFIRLPGFFVGLGGQLGLFSFDPLPLILTKSSCSCDCKWVFMSSIYHRLQMLKGGMVARLLAPVLLGAVLACVKGDDVISQWNKAVVDTINQNKINPNVSEAGAPMPYMAGLICDALIILLAGCRTDAGHCAQRTVPRGQGSAQGQEIDP